MILETNMIEFRQCGNIIIIFKFIKPILRTKFSFLLIKNLYIFKVNKTLMLILIRMMFDISLL